MTGVRVALDTVTAIRVLNGEPSVSNRLTAERIFGLPVTVVGELFFGALNSARAVLNCARYGEFVETAIVIETTAEIARRYAELRVALKGVGRPIPQNDMWVAATCLHHGLVLVTSDEHFAACPGLLIEDW